MRLAAIQLKIGTFKIDSSKWCASLFRPFQSKLIKLLFLLQIDLRHFISLNKWHRENWIVSSFCPSSVFLQGLEIRACIYNNNMLVFIRTYSEISHSIQLTLTAPPIYKDLIVLIPTNGMGELSANRVV